MRIFGFLVAFPLLFAPLYSSCAVEEESSPDEEYGEARSAITVDQVIDGDCSATTQLEGLDLQIIEQANCIVPGAYLAVPPLANVTVVDGVYAFLEEPARDALVAAVNQNPGMGLQINSMLRTVAEQYVLYTWWQQGRCGITAAATPGQSNHESGLALDIQQYDAWRPALQSHGFTWLGSGDPWHFDYTGAGAVDHRGTDVLAFQMLWNINHPNDPIDEDGLWGPQTAARMAQAPAEGFPMGANCGDAPDVWLASSFTNTTDRFADGASAGVTDLFEGDAVEWVVQVENRGTVAAESVVVAHDAGDALVASSFAVERGNAANNTQGSFADGKADVTLAALEPGEIAFVRVAATGGAYSVDDEAPASAKAFVRKVDDRYEATAFGADPTNDGSQTFNDGALEIETQADLYSHVKWEFESDRREGVTGEGMLSIATGALSIGAADGAYAVTPVTSVVGNEATKLILRAKRNTGSGDATLIVFADDEVDIEAGKSATGASVVLALPADGMFHDITLDAAAFPALAGTIRRVAFLPFATGSGPAAVDHLRIEGAVVEDVPPSDPGTGGGGGAAGGGSGDEESCTCKSAPGSSGSVSVAGWLMALLFLFERRRRR
jgi:MYXO-CTERM domain-containing protein